MCEIIHANYFYDMKICKIMCVISLYPFGPSKQRRRIIAACNRSVSLVQVQGNVRDIFAQKGDAMRACLKMRHTPKLQRFYGK